MERPECLDPETLAAYLDGLLAGDAIDRADRHIDHCTTCRGELSALAATHSFPAGSGAFGIVDALPLAGRLGRYEILRELGRGSMGVVVRAYDPELERAVAVKILDTRRWDELHARGALRREAQAMARLTHPNVVGVYDVVAHGDAICIAMELVEGETLAAYARDRDWRDTLAACIAAGRGLAAAHAAKLIHRDYKPDNVLCAADGRVVVSDFGLARLEVEASLDRAAPALQTTLAGTPAYMAPELFRRRPATVASDQFSFCVATWEVLYGARPFAGDTLAELGDSIAAGVPRVAPPGTRVPPWVRTVLVRGLSADPARRFASLADLLDALERDPARRRRRIARLAIAALAGALATGAIVSLHLPERLADVARWLAERK